MVHFWIRCETKPDEHRVALLPEHCKALLDAGHRVTVERWPDRCTPDAEYEALFVRGLEMAPHNSWPLAPKDAVILGLKDLYAKPYLAEHQHIMFAHCFKGQDAWKDVLWRFEYGHNAKIWDLVGGGRARVANPNSL